MRTAIAVLVVALLACGGSPSESAQDTQQQADAPEILAPTALTAVTWTIVNGDVVCPGASARIDNSAVTHVRAIRCQWACGSYAPVSRDPTTNQTYPAVSGREVRLAIAYMPSVPGARPDGWMLYSEQFDLPGACTP